MSASLSVVKNGVVSATNVATATTPETREDLLKETTVGVEISQCAIGLIDVGITLRDKLQKATDTLCKDAQVLNKLHTSVGQEALRDWRHSDYVAEVTSTAAIKLRDAIYNFQVDVTSILDSLPEFSTLNHKDSLIGIYKRALSLTSLAADDITELENFSSSVRDNHRLQMGEILHLLVDNTRTVTAYRESFALINDIRDFATDAITTKINLQLTSLASGISEAAVESPVISIKQAISAGQKRPDASVTTKIALRNLELAFDRLTEGIKHFDRWVDPGSTHNDSVRSLGQLYEALKHAVTVSGDFTSLHAISHDGKLPPYVRQSLKEILGSVLTETDPYNLHRAFGIHHQTLQESISGEVRSGRERCLRALEAEMIESPSDATASLLRNAGLEGIVILSSLAKNFNGQLSLNVALEELQKFVHSFPIGNVYNAHQELRNHYIIELYGVRGVLLDVGRHIPTGTDESLIASINSALARTDSIIESFAPKNVSPTT